MKMLRRITGDRASATAIAVLAAYLLLLQGFVGGMTRSAMAAADPLHIICMSDGTTVGDLPSHDGGSSKAGTDCTSLCRLAATTPAAILPGVAVLGVQNVHQLYIAPFGASRDIVLALRDLLPQPRAPPFLS